MKVRGTTAPMRFDRFRGRTFKDGAYLGQDELGHRHLVVRESLELSRLNATCVGCGERVEWIPSTWIRSRRSCTQTGGHHWALEADSDGPVDGLAVIG